eukprot:Gb_00555 [translate_table: standard]
MEIVRAPPLQQEGFFVLRVAGCGFRGSAKGSRLAECTEEGVFFEFRGRRLRTSYSVSLSQAGAMVCSSDHDLFGYVFQEGASNSRTFWWSSFPVDRSPFRALLDSRYSSHGNLFCGASCFVSSCFVSVPCVVSEAVYGFVTVRRLAWHFLLLFE